MAQEVFINQAVPKNRELALRVSNDLLTRSQYDLTLIQQDIIYYFISAINPNAPDLHEIRVPVRELKKIVKNNSDKRWGSLDGKKGGRLADVILSLGDAKLIPDYTLRSESGGFINWFQYCLPIRHNGEEWVRAMFTEPLKEHLQDLQKYAKVFLTELLPIKSKTARRLFLYLKAKRGEKSNYEEMTTITIELNELKAILMVEDKYPAFKEFKRTVLLPAEKRINEHSSIKIIKIRYKRTGRSISHIIFEVIDQEVKSSVSIPEHSGENHQLVLIEPSVSKEDMNKLTQAQYLAFELLSGSHLPEDVRVPEHTAIHKIIKPIKGSEVEGFEDIFVRHALEHIQNKANSYTKEVIVNWWVKNKTFEPDSKFGDVWSRIVEKVVAHKKHLQKNDPMAWNNRMRFKKATRVEFRLATSQK